MKQSWRIIVLVLISLFVVMLIVRRLGITQYPPEAVWARESYYQLAVVQSLFSNKDSINETSIREAIAMSTQSSDVPSIPYSHGPFPSVGASQPIIVGDIAIFPQALNNEPVATTRYSPGDCFIILDATFQIKYITPETDGYISPK